MIDKKLDDLSTLKINQFKIIEEINSLLFKTEALINLGIQTDFLELSKLTIYEYLTILKDFVSLAIKHIEGLDYDMLRYKDEIDKKRLKILEELANEAQKHDMGYEE
jgi:hypothetical protein